MALYLAGLIVCLEEFKRLLWSFLRTTKLAAQRKPAPLIISLLQIAAG